MMLCQVDWEIIVRDIYSPDKPRIDYVDIAQWRTSTFLIRSLSIEMF